MRTKHAATICPICHCVYGAGVYQPGDRCGDLSTIPTEQWDAFPEGCPGIVVDVRTMPDDGSAMMQQFDRDWRGCAPDQQGVVTMNARTEFFKDGNVMAIRTNANDERDFVESVSLGLAGMIEEKQFDGDWDFQLERWLPCVIDIACRLRGYKANVVETRVLTAGEVRPNENMRVHPAAADDSIPVQTAVVFGAD